MSSQLYMQSKKHVKPTQTTAFSLRVVRVIHEARMCHGLRHSDYQLYRQYCSRRIRRIRKRFDLRQGDKKFKRRDLHSEGIRNEKLMELPMLQAERSWAYAMQLKEESFQDPRKKFSLRNKLRKAAGYAVAFEKLMEGCGKCDARTQLEIQGYSAWLQGTVLFELAEWTLQWNAPVAFFNKAVAIYSKLSEAVSDDTERSILTEELGKLEVQLRYCRHHLGDSAATSSLLDMTDSGALGEKLNVLVSQAREKQASTLSEVTWKSRTMSVKHEKVRLFLLKEGEVNDSQFSGQDRVDRLDQLLMECKDAAAIVREDLHQDPTFKSRQQASSGAVSSLHLLYSYLCYLRLRLTVQRNMALIDTYNAVIAGKAEAAKGAKVPRDQDVVRLYDLAVQSLTEMGQLAGLEQDLELQQENQAQTAFYRAMRCYHVGESYARQDKWAEALVLYSRTLKRIEEAKQNPLSEVDSSALESLTQRVDVAECTAKAQGMLSMSSGVTTKGASPAASPAHIAKKVLADRMDEYIEDQCLLNHTNPRVVSLPPAMSAVPCKPLFFDLALNHIAFPSIDHKLPLSASPSSAAAGGAKGAAIPAGGAATPAAAAATEQQGGLSGLVKGLWGWGSKK